MWSNSVLAHAECRHCNLGVPALSRPCRLPSKPVTTLAFGPHAEQDVDNEVTQFRARRRTAMEQQGDVGASVFSAADTAAAAVGATGHAQGGAARQRVVFAADLERYAQPVPPHVMEANMAEIFTRDLSLQLA